MAERFMCSVVIAAAGVVTATAEAAWPLSMSDLLRFADGVAEGRASPAALVTACYPPDLPPDLRERIEEETRLLPAVLMGLDERYWVDIQVWTGDGLQGPAGRAVPAHLTYSFPDDGAAWGGFNGRPIGLNILNQRLIETFGAAGLDEGREYIRQALAGYSKHSGLTYDEVPDDSAPMSTDPARSATRGDIRIGGFDNPCNCAAYNGFPSGLGITDTGGGDMCINTAFFTLTQYQDPENNYRWLRNVIAHEHGHGVGNIHSIPCDGTKAMEPFVNLGFDMLQIDDRRAIARSYGDRFAGNNSPGNAADLGVLDAGSPASVVLRHLSLNGAAGLDNTDEDWFRIIIRATRDLVIGAVPTGGTYTAGQQESSCGGTTFPINATAAGNIEVGLYASNGTTAIQTVNATSNGQSETLTANDLAPGLYFIRVRDRGFNTPVNQFVQLYSLFVRVDGTPAPPVAVAGINKRCRANTPCWFMGDINSYTTDGLVNVIQNYEWDRDGDGVFDVIKSPKTSFSFPSNGVYTVTLRVTDMLGQGADSIRVEVWGATTSIDSVLPSEIRPGQTLPVTIFGRNFKNVNSLAHFSLGPGLTLSGTPVSDALGTRLSGLFVTAGSFTPPGPRSLTITNADGSDTAYAAFTVVPPGCEGDANHDGDITFADITAVLQAYGSSPGPGGFGDANSDGVVTFADITSVLELLTIGCG
jgi:hypothetical protein